MGRNWSQSPSFWNDQYVKNDYNYSNNSLIHWLDGILRSLLFHYFNGIFLIIFYMFLYNFIFFLFFRNWFIWLKSTRSKAFVMFLLQPILSKVYHASFKSVFCFPFYFFHLMKRCFPWCYWYIKLFQTSGLGGLRHNTVVIAWPDAWRSLNDTGACKLFASTLRAAAAAKCAILVPKNIRLFPKSHEKVCFRDLYSYGYA